MGVECGGYNRPSLEKRAVNGLNPDLRTRERPDLAAKLPEREEAEEAPGARRRWFDMEAAEEREEEEISLSIGVLGGERGEQASRS